MNSLGKLHFIGIGGSGMSPLARVALEMGYSVSGSDLREKPILDELRKLGAKIFIGHAPGQIDGAETVIYTSDIPADNAELMAARERPIRLMHRSDLLAYLLDTGKGIAVSGSHGKTTTTSLISFILERAGADPTYIIGGEMLGGKNARAGKGGIVAAEADESDRTFLKYHPLIAVITNIEPDHLENYDEDYGKMKEAFLQFANQVKPGGRVVCGIDDPDVREIFDRIKGGVITFGIEEKGADYLATDLSSDGGLSFTLVERGERLGRIRLPLVGRHNIYNALAAMAVVRFLGLSFDQVKGIMADFHGAKRRFERIGEVAGVEVIDDYAVHPTEIEAVLKAAKERGGRVLALFQPHRMARAYFLFDRFAEAFKDADALYVTEIYSPKGDIRFDGMNAERLAREIARRSGVKVHFVPDKGELVERLLQEVRARDQVITLGAGDINQVGYRLLERLRSKG